MREKMETIGERISYLLKKENATLKELSTYLEIPLSILTSVVHDKSKPGINTAIAVAEYFGVSLDWFVTGRGHVERHEEYGSQPHVLRKDKEMRGNIQIDLSDSIQLPSGETVDERRSDFKSPFVKEILSLIRKLTPDQRKKVLQLINLTFDLESN